MQSGVSRMNLHAKLLEREAAGRPVTVGLIGAGKFGTMFLSQARLTRAACMSSASPISMSSARAASSRPPAGMRPLMPRPRSATRSRPATTHVGADADALIAFPDVEVIVEATGDPKIRHPLRARSDRARQAHRDGECRSRRARGPAAGAQGAGGGRGLQPRLGRSAGADLRACRLGARLRASR